ncbi:GPCR kinase [Tanacetum coccineum]
MKDLSGTIPGTISHKVIDEGGYGKNIIVGAAMILTNVSVFTLKPSKHYLNIPMRNVVEVFRKNTVSESGSGTITPWVVALSPLPALWYRPAKNLNGVDGGVTTPTPR